MARAAIFALAVLALTAGGFAEKVVAVDLQLADAATKLKINTCIDVINAVVPGGVNAVRGTGFCPVDSAIEKFLVQLGYKKSAGTPVAFVTANPQLIPFIQRVFQYHTLASDNGLIFGVDFDEAVKGKGVTPYNTSLTLEDGTAAKLYAGLLPKSYASLDVRGITNLASPQDGTNKARSTYLNAVVGKVNGTTVSVFHAISKVLIPPQTFYTVRKAVQSLSNKKYVAANGGDTFAKYLNKWVAGAGKTFTVATAAGTLFGPTDAAVAAIAIGGLGPVTPKGLKSKNTQQALLKYAFAPGSNWYPVPLNSSFGAGLSWTNFYAARSSGLLSTLVSSLGGNYTVSTSVSGADFLVQGTANLNATATDRLITYYAGAATILVLDAQPLVPSTLP